MNTDVMFSSRKEDWETPQSLFDELDREFCFTVDVCADDRNHKCDRYFRKTDPVDGLHMSWTGRCWMNPPYGRDVGKWIKKASEEVKKKAEVVVSLLPARTDTKWFHEYIYGRASVEIRFLKGRLRFSGGGWKSCAISEYDCDFQTGAGRTDARLGKIKSRNSLRQCMRIPLKLEELLEQNN